MSDHDASRPPRVPAPDLSDAALAELVSLRGRGAVVTGGARGIGAQVCVRLAEAGAEVTVADLDADAAAGVAAGLCERFGGRHRGVAADITSTPGLAELAAAVAARPGGLRIWVNNAGIYPTTGPVLDATDDLLERVLAVNVRGTFAASREAARRMGAGGVVVNLASTTAFHGAVGISAYSTSKHAVIGLTRNLAIELGPLGIRVVGVAPTVIDTPGVREQLEPLRVAGLDVAARMADNPLGRGGVPDDVARVVLFAVSDLAAFVTGSTIPVDAGALA